jgi:erythrin-vacuolar iron transport family protein
MMRVLEETPMPPAIDFATLSLVDALDLAILIEDEARERYEEFADQMDLHHTPDAAGFFREMAINETKHGTELAQRRQALFPTEPRRVTRDMLWDVEAPGFDEARMFMSVHDAMDVALAAEIKAHDYFAAALEHVSNADVKALFTELRDEEVEHQEMVKAATARLPPRSTENPDDYADEPVGQG